MTVVGTDQMPTTSRGRESKKPKEATEASIVCGRRSGSYSDDVNEAVELDARRSRICTNDARGAPD